MYLLDTNIVSDLVRSPQGSDRTMHAVRRIMEREALYGAAVHAPR